MEGIEKAAAGIASGLRETLAAVTVDFIINTSLRILPLASRESKSSAWDNEPARRREKQFNILMRYIASAYTRGNEKTFEGAQKTIIMALKKTDEALVTDFKQLMRIWKHQRAVAPGPRAVIDEYASPSENLKSLFTTTIASSTKLDPTRGGNGSQMTAMTSEHGHRPGDERKMDDLANSLASAFTKYRISTQPHDSKSSENKQARLPNLFVTQKQPCEANDFGVETQDGVLVGHPPAYPPALLDWESSDDNEEFEELVSNRRARVASQTPASPDKGRTRGNEAKNSTSLEGDESGSDDEWVCL